MKRMRLRLAGGVVAAPGLAAWLPRAAASPASPQRVPSPRRVLDEGSVPPGAAIALGPDEATDEEVREAVTALRHLIDEGGVVAAGAGVDLGAGFRSARLAGARGDQRDAVLAALKVLGVEDAGRLGDRAGFLVALFGPSVTKRVGAAAAKAIGEGRWAALHLASAASDMLGPEQLERVLAVRAPAGVTDADLIGGAQPSVLAVNLRRVLDGVTGPRRLDLLLDLWDQVGDHHLRRLRRARMLAAQARQDRLGDLRKRRRHFEDEVLMSRLRGHFGREPSLLEAARWQPWDEYWYGVLNQVLRDALAATALLHAAIAVSDHGLEEGLARTGPMIRAAADEGAMSAPHEIALARRQVPGLSGLPARPTCHVADIAQKLDARPFRDGRPVIDDKGAGYIRQRLPHARDYALLTMETARDLLYGDDDVEVPERVRLNWAQHDLRLWRRRVGYATVRPPSGWTCRTFGKQEPLADRLAALTDPDPAEVEQVGDLLWLADLVDALAMLHGHEAAVVEANVDWIDFDHDPGPGLAPGVERLVLEHASIASAVSGAAQLTALGGTAKRGERTWTGFVERLLADTKITEAMDGGFAVPEPLAAVDGTILPGTDGVRFTLARNARMLTEWSNHMGNCIAGPYYLEEATAGKCALAALYGKDGRVLVNAELVPTRPDDDRGWRIAEIAGRFNENPDQALAKRLRAWITGIPSTAAPVERAAPEDDAPSGGPMRGTAARPRLLQEIGPILGGLAERAWAEEMDDGAADVLAALAEGTRVPEAALTTLRRLGPGPLANACRDAIARGEVDLADLWELTEVRPLRTVLDRLDPALRDRFERLDLLNGATPLPGSLRKLVRRPQVAPAYSMGLVALRVRAAIGRLVLDADEAVVRSVPRRTSVPMLCALTIHLTCADPGPDLVPVTPPRIVTVPGFPASTLDDEDGPWQQAFPDARELGTDTGVFWDRIAEHGLRVPEAWVSRGGGWPVLWARAHHPRRETRP